MFTGVSDYIYLAGPITGLSWDEAMKWRIEVAELLPVTFTPLNPLRGQEHLKNEKCLEFNYSDHPLSNTKSIKARDRNDIRRSSLVLVNLLGTTKVSIGTVMEIMWATEANVPIVLVMEDDNIHNHDMLLDDCHFRANNLKDAVSLVFDVLSVGIM